MRVADSRAHSAAQRRVLGRSWASLLLVEDPQVAAQLLTLHPERRLVLGENLLPHGAPGLTLAKVQPPAGDTLLRHVVVFGGGEEDGLDRVLQLLAQLMVMVVAPSISILLTRAATGSGAGTAWRCTSAPGPTDLRPWSTMRMSQQHPRHAGAT